MYFIRGKLVQSDVSIKNRKKVSVYIAWKVKLRHEMRKKQQQKPISRHVSSCYNDNV